jgi:hypothetical protein
MTNNLVADYGGGVIPLDGMSGSKPKVAVYQEVI